MEWCLIDLPEYKVLLNRQVVLVISIWKKFFFSFLLVPLGWIIILHWWNNYSFLFQEEEMDWPLRINWNNHFPSKWIHCYCKTLVIYLCLKAMQKKKKKVVLHLLLATLSTMHETRCSPQFLKIWLDNMTIFKHRISMFNLLGHLHFHNTFHQVFKVLQ